MPQSTLINQLRDLHFPEPPSIWPLAYGWNMTMLLITIVLGYILYKIVKKWIRFRAKRIAIKKIDILKSNASTESNVIQIATLSILLRRVGLAYFNREKIAGLTGINWLEFLDETGDTDEFTKGVGKLLITAPYQKHVNHDLSELMDIVKHWVEKRK